MNNKNIAANSPEIKIPELTCQGCIGRDRINMSLSQEIDRLNAIIENIRFSLNANDIKTFDLLTTKKAA